MKQVIYGLTFCLLAISQLCSCSSDDSSTAATLSSDCYISSFTLGTLKRSVVSVDDDGDTVTTYVTFAGSYYPLSIDHSAGTITNREPLPYGTLTQAVLATITAQGSVVYTDETTPADTTVWTAYSSSDSIDFSQPLLFRVYATDGSGYRAYLLNLNVRQAEAGSYTWQQMDALPATSAPTATHIVMRPDSLLAYYTTADSSLPTCAAMPLNASASWTVAATSGTEGADISTMQSAIDALWMSTANGHLLTSSDGRTWQTVSQGTATTTVQLLAASATTLYARVADTGADATAIIAASTDGHTWTAIQLDSDASLFPSHNTTAVAYTQTNGNKRVLIGGLCSNEATAGTAATWSLREGSGEPWALFITSKSPYSLAFAQPTSIVCCNSMLIAVDNGIHVSHDNGISWSTEEQPSLPASIDPSTARSAVSDGTGIYLASGTQLWHATLNE